MTESLNLENTLLVATPAMGDPRFRHAVIYVCSHDADGAMGIVLNRPKRGRTGITITLTDLLDSIGVKGEPRVADTPVLAGGPVDMERGFVLHTPDYRNTNATQALSDTLMMTSTRDVLDSLVTDKAPERAVLAVGYAGWGEGQLETELSGNAWLVCKAEPEAIDNLVFAADHEAKWAEALAQIGIDPAMLSAAAGSA